MRRRLKCDSKMAANCVPLTIVLVSLFTLAIAASSSSLPTRSGDQLRVVKPIVRLPGENNNWLDNEARVLEALGLSGGQQQFNQDNQQLKQAISSISSEPLAIRQQQQQPQIDEADNDNNNNDDDDEQFLRQLLIAGDYLKDKLAVRESDADLQLANESPRYALELPSKFYLAPEYPHRDSSGAAADDDNLNSEVDLSNNNANAKNNLLKYLLLLDKAQVAQDDDHQQAAHAEKRKAADLQPDDLNDRDEQASLQKAPIKYTTLLEDEQVDNNNNATITSSTSAPVTTSTTASYGQLISNYDAQKLESSETGSSTFARMYNKLAHYLPFLGQMDILRGRDVSTTQAAISSSQSGDKKVEVATGRQQVTQSNDNEVNKVKQAQDKHEEQPAKQRVSMTLNKKNSHQVDEQHKDDNNDDNQKYRVQVNRKSEFEEDNEEFSGQFKDKAEQKSGVQVVSANSKRLSISLTPGEEFELSQMIGPVVRQQENSKQGVNLIRQSSLVLPLSSASLSSASELSSSGDNGESLLGKYIYAPTQHYYLSAPPPHHSGPASAAYAAYQKAPTTDAWTSFGAHSLGGAPAAAAMQTSKPSNDLYFLVMVGAFCMMAMAIVLAAGAFAYRVQQQRKSSQEPDYPTYGVVGPNNMASKCNAFGYFNNQHTGNPPAYGGGGGATGSSKSPSCGSAATTAGSAKHLAELYAAAAAAGVGGGGDSGLASSLDKCSSGSSGSVGSKKQLQVATTAAAAAQSTNGSTSAAAAASSGNQDAARMYHYQHQKQQMILSSGASFGQAGKRHTSASDLDSEDEDNDDGSYTVYECPGLASAHEMEIKNPLFNDDHSP